MNSACYIVVTHLLPTYLHLRRYRTSGDINNSPMSWYSNLQTTIQFQDPINPLSVPGCWAYPDMLEVGRIHGADGKMDYGWNRAHFGAWCVVSAPLILGMDVTKQEIVGPVIDIITNPEAIAVNQVSSAPRFWLFPCSNRRLLRSLPSMVVYVALNCTLRRRGMDTLEHWSGQGRVVR